MLVLVQVVGGLGNGAGLAVGGLLLKDVTGSSGWSGMAVVMLTLGAAAFTVPLSSIAARTGRRPALTLGWVSGAIGAAVTVVASEADSLLLALVGLLLFGGSTAANLQSRFAATDRAATDKIGRSLSLVVWSTTIGAVIGPNLTGPGASLARSVGVPDLAGPMIFSAVGFGIAGLLTFALLRPDPLIQADGWTGRTPWHARGTPPPARPHPVGPVGHRLLPCRDGRGHGADPGPHGGSRREPEDHRHDDQPAHRRDVRPVAADGLAGRHAGARTARSCWGSRSCCWRSSSPARQAARRCRSRSD